MLFLFLHVFNLSLHVVPLVTEKQLVERIRKMVDEKSTTALNISELKKRVCL